MVALSTVQLAALPIVLSAALNHTVGNTALISLGRTASKVCIRNAKYMYGNNAL